MATVTVTETVTETEQTALNIKSSGDKTELVPDNTSEKKSTEDNKCSKVIDNKSNIRQSNIQSDTSTPLSNDNKDVLNTQVSLLEEDGNPGSDTDSEGSDKRFENEFECLEITDEEGQELPSDQNGCDEVGQSLEHCCTQPVSVIPKDQVQSETKKENKNNRGKGARIHPVKSDVKKSTFPTDLKNTEISENHGPNGNGPNFNTTPSYKSVSSYSMAASSIQPKSQGHMKDFVIIHTKADSEGVQVFKKHLHNDFGISNLTVETFDNVGLGKSELRKAATLHDSFRYILIFVTDNLEDDWYTQFINEIVLIRGLKNEKGQKNNDEKRDRVVPVLTGCQYEDQVLCCITSLRYFNFKSTKPSLREAYLNSVKSLFKMGRVKFP
ncbi:uncharacterized protein LOC132731049 [Ruditapes philippinarum]|uniref:uncharacterized protein LOC132731049 n=1 Tax=Ruditapes philippinarum TaxID=129788 RepID=UPI00295BB48D|nr:uncharacterized protein LOC132731049 [Ruditapes philippinarum]